MTKWEQFEEYLFERDLLGEEFNHAAVAEDLCVSGKEASLLIQSYLGAQTRPDSKTLFVLRRVPGTRTASAMWHVGERALDGRALGEQWVDDAKRRIERYIEPSLRRIAEKNPRALPAARAVAKGIEASLELMSALMDPA
jgi:hypothetical protein